ncbi:MAG: Maf family protein [Solirubrobacteraceae bacterium]
MGRLALDEIVSRPPAFVLASASPQRRAILERLGVSFEVRPTHVTEIDRGEPAQVAVENALLKARAAHTAGVQETVLGVDTLVALGTRIYGKPADEHAARETIAALCAETHTVVSGIALLRGDREQVGLARTEVVFRRCSEELIDWYVASGEWRGRAGGYAIQGVGAMLVCEIRGDYENVVGLPVAKLIDMAPELFPVPVNDRP